MNTLNEVIRFTDAAVMIEAKESFNELAKLVDSLIAIDQEENVIDVLRAIKSTSRGEAIERSEYYFELSLIVVENKINVEFPDMGNGFIEVIIDGQSKILFD